MKSLLTVLVVLIVAGCESPVRHIEASHPEDVFSIAEAMPSRDVSIPQSTIREPQGLQTDRRELIEELIRNGIFTKVEMRNTFPRIWVTPSFMVLDSEMREDCTELVYVYYHDGTKMSDSVVLTDAAAGEYLGFYNPFSGGLKTQ